MMSALRFDCAGEQLVGVLTHPKESRSDLAVLVVVGGPQYRVGSHRLFVKLGLELAEAGVPTLRFDVRGMGDSSGAQRSFEALSDDIGAAIDALQRAQPQVRRVVLWGLCDGASAALLYCHERPDPRVAGLCLLNPWVRSEATLARTHLRHYYLQRLTQREFWVKLLSGRVARKAWNEWWASVKAARAAGAAAGAAADSAAGAAHTPFPIRMALGLQRARVPTLLVLSGHDLTAKEFEDHAARDAHWRRAFAAFQHQLSRHALPQAAHTFSVPAQVRACFLYTSPSPPYLVDPRKPSSA